MPLTPRHAAATHVGRVRQSNEDRFYADPGAGIFVVADGMGGHAAGEVAAEIASTLIGKKLSAAADIGGKTLAYHFLTDSASALYMWESFLDAMGEWGGAPVGLDAVRGLASAGGAG